jgi:hypothetical protein
VLSWFNSIKVKKYKNLMVIENQIPKTEMVYELKNEIPSFEDFIKTYDYDENIASSYYLENQTQEKGYGPCYKDCGWANPDCQCYISEACVPLHLVCPAPKNS